MRSPTRYRLAAIAAMFCLSAPLLAQDSGEAPKPIPWAKEMEKFAAADEKHPPRPGGIVFAGSSSIVRWDLAKTMEGLEPKPVNRGFGGSQVSDLVQHLERAVLVHKPRVVVVYSGDNDVAAGKEVKEVVADYKKLMHNIHAALPEARIVIISIKPSRARWKLAEPMSEVNAQVRELCEQSERSVFVDLWEPMLGEDGEPRAEWFVDDGLHLSDEGYRLWTKKVRPVVERQYKIAMEGAEGEGE